MRTIADLIGDAPALAGLAPHHLELIAGCGENTHFHAGATLAGAGQSADHFFLVRHGSVALELAVPQHDALTISTLHDGDIAGLSWLFAPHRWMFDGRAVEDTQATEYIAAEQQLDAELLQQMAAVAVSRLQATRLQLLDVYAR